jgi:rhodanese-related sulfurtransferase/biotin operon repressor
MPPVSQSQAFKPQLFEQFARIGQALASGPRLEILELLIQSPRSVDSIAKVMGLPIANISQHLQTLKQAGLVSAMRDGRSMVYSITGSDVIELLLLLQKIAKDRFAEIDRLVDTYLNSRDELEPLSVAEVLSKARKGEVVILDVRPSEEYAAGHLKGAINLTLEELEERLEDLPKDKTIVAYCRGTYCILSFDAVKTLRDRGYKAHRVSEGIPNWIINSVRLVQDTK